MKEYALYKGDDFIMIGSLEELASYLGVKESSVYFYSMPAYRKRNGDNALVVIRIEDDENG